MKRIFWIMTLCVALAACSGETTTPIADSPARVVGRTMTLDDGSIAFDWSGVYIDIRFRGSYLAVELSDTKRNYLNLWIDGREQEKLTSEGEHTMLVLFNDPTASTSSACKRLPRPSRGASRCTASQPMAVCWRPTI